MERIYTQKPSDLTLSKILHLSKLKGFAGDKINMVKELNFVLKRGRKHCRNSKKCWLPAISFFLTVFSKDFLYRVVKSRDLCG